MSLKALRDKKAALISESEALFGKAAAENRPLTDAEKTRDDAIGAELDAINGDIVRATRHAERMRDAPAADDGNGRSAALAGVGHNSKRFVSLGEMAISVAEAGRAGGRLDPRLLQAGPTGMNEGVGSDGGFLVQQDIAADLVKPMWELGDVASRVRRIPISGGSSGLKLNAINETSRANGSRWGGVQAYWTAEAGLLTASAPKLRQMTLNLEKLTGLCYATEELLKDSTALGSILSQAFTEEFTFKVEDAIFNGTGGGMPLGFMNSGATITVSKESGQAAATIQVENILKMWARLPARLRKNAVWYINQDIEPQLYLMKYVVKNVAGTENVGGFAAPIYMPPTPASSGFGSLMGRPVIPVEYCATLGTAGDIVLMAPGEYLMIDKGGVEAAESMHVRFLYDEMTFRFVYRADGQSAWNSAVTPKNGTSTVSPFVILETRS